MHRKYLLFLLLMTGYPISAQSLNDLFQDAKNLMTRGEYHLAFSKLQKIDSMRPYHPAVINALLEVSGKLQDTANSLKYLRVNLLMQGKTDHLQQLEFSFLEDTQEWQQLLALAENMSRVTENADTAFVLNNKKLHPEGLAYDPERKVFLVSSIHEGKIVKVDEDGNASDFAVSPLLRAVSGLAVHASKGVLWASSCEIPELETYREAQNGRCSLIKIDLQSGQIISSYPADSTKKHHWGDLIVDVNGNVLISDSMQPAIYVLKDGSAQIEEFTSSDLWMNLQGLCLSDDGRWLYVADYITGLYKISYANPRDIKKISVPDNFLAKGIDGLYLHRNKLISIQNGVQPFRVASLSLDRAGEKVEECKYLELGSPHLGEPTLGTLVDDQLYFIANSPWGYYKNGRLELENVPDPLVLRLDLNSINLPK